MGINPPTPVDVVLPYIDLLDCVLVMTVHPGFGGQKFISDCMSKVCEQQTSDFLVWHGIGTFAILKGTVKRMTAEGL